MFVRRKSFVAFAVLACLGLAAQGCKKDGAAGGGATGPDLGTPKSAALAFASAVKAGDAAAIRATSTGTEEQFKTVEALSQVMAASKEFAVACEAKFGKDNALSKQFGSGMPDPAEEVNKSEVKEEGDVATLVDKAKPNEKHPMKLKKADGKWKVDLASMGDEGKEIAGKAPKMAAAMREAAADVKAGKYPNAEAAVPAISAKMMQSMQ